MLSKTEVEVTVTNEIVGLVNEDGDESVELTGTESLTELGVNSLLLARLLIQLEASLGVDPFAQGRAAIAEMRTVADLVSAYEAVAVVDAGVES